MVEDTKRLDDTVYILDGMAIAELVGRATVASRMVAQQRKFVRATDRIDVAGRNRFVCSTNAIPVYCNYSIGGIYVDHQ